MSPSSDNFQKLNQPTHRSSVKMLASVLLVCLILGYARPFTISKARMTIRRHWIVSLNAKTVEVADISFELPTVGLWLDMRSSLLSIYRATQYLNSRLHHRDFKDNLQYRKDFISGVLVDEEIYSEDINDAKFTFPIYSCVKNQKVIQQVSDGKSVGSMIGVGCQEVNEYLSLVEKNPNLHLFFIDKIKPSNWQEALSSIEVVSSIANEKKITLAITVQDECQVTEAVMAVFRGRSSNLFITDPNASVDGRSATAGNHELVLVIEPDPKLLECCLLFM